mmetsp:Transcript_21927/g.34342  ORF Transcript_21927/g.34342 Transcript_21927/m.34342 type:complete len:921 (-) Transcript_21927:930-3692(-)
MLISFLYPAQNTDLVNKLKAKQMTVFGMDCMPRTLSRAQTFDALSSMANIAGYRAVVESANAFGRFFAGQFTAAGKVPPAKVLIIGAGVAGLAAIQQAKGMGAIVRAFDVRSSVKEQILSAGAEFLEVQLEEDGEGSGGYAKTMSKEFIEAEMALFADQAKDVDIIITTALIPGKKAPILITKDMIETMRPGSVVVDLAAEAGGNIETTKPGENYVYKGVTHIGYTDLPSRLPTQSSSLYANNIAKYLLSMGPKGRFNIDLEDEAVRGALVLQSGEMMWPPPKVETPPPPAKKEAPAPVVKEELDPNQVAFNFALGKSVTVTSFAAILLGLAAVAGSSLTTSVTVLILACLAGSQVVYGVTPALHSPLMSVTNAISGMTAVGGLVLMGGGTLPQTGAQSLAALAVLVSMVNIGGGFIMTNRMLGMFRREGDAPAYRFLYLIPAALLLGGYVAATAAGVAQLSGMVYLVSSVFCILAIGGLASQTTAQFGNAMGLIGVAGGLSATLGSLSVPSLVYQQVGITMAAGTATGVAVASKVGVTELPQLVAAFHSLVGLAAVATAIASFMIEGAHATMIHKVSAYIAAVIGAVTLTGSIVAFAKLQGLVKGKALVLPFKRVVNAGLIVAIAYSLSAFLAAGAAGLSWLLTASVVAGVFGFIVAAGVGAGDMPVVITLLNSASGWALCAEGFVLNNNLLNIVGALIGSSGAILSDIMCKAMNKGIANTVGVFTPPPKIVPKAEGSQEPQGEAVTTNVDTTVAKLVNAKTVRIVPGYGLAVSKGQYPLAEIVQTLVDSGKQVQIIVHPVAGRMPGQLNVLLAEAGIPYDIVLEMEEVEGDWDDVDVTLVIGANDTVNCAAEDDPNCDIYGMPVIRVWDSKQVVFFKRSLAVGYAGLDNPVFYKDNTNMLLGDAKDVLNDLRDNLRAV